MSMNTSDLEVAVTPQFSVPSAHEAVARVNRWLHREIGTAVHAAAATFDPTTFYRYAVSLGTRAWELHSLCRSGS